MRGTFVRAIMIAAIVTGVSSPVMRAASVAATLDGHAITLAQAGSLSCDDFAYPIIRCFDSAAQLANDVAIQIAKRTSAAPLAPLSIGYVVVWADITYGGASKVLSTNVPWLSDIGWNDRISSFKSYGVTGRFYENSPSGGFVYFFGATTQVSDVGAYYNDKFSAFYTY